jgi:hypothetical protein
MRSDSIVGQFIKGSKMKQKEIGNWAAQQPFPFVKERYS